MHFSGCDSYTVGAEWELQLLDSASLDLTPGITSLLQELEPSSYVKPELIQSCVELNTPISSNASEIERHLLALTGDVLHVCKTHGMTLAGAGTHPFCQRLALITELPRYELAAAEHGYIAHSRLAFATHIHIGIGSGDEAIRTMRYLTPCLPLLIALSANSPFWRGHNTGYASYRRRLLAASRSYGIPPCFEGWQEFAEFYDMASRAGSIRSIKDIHWDIRPHPDFGTIEVRVMDAQSTAAQVAFIAGVVRVFAVWIASSSREEIESTVPLTLSPWIDRENHYRASHWGMNADLIAEKFGQTRPLISYIQSLAIAVKSIATEIGEAEIPSRLAEMLPKDCGYHLQRQVYSKKKRTRDVALFLRDCVEVDTPPPSSIKP